MTQNGRNYLVIGFANVRISASAIIVATSIAMLARTSKSAHG
jgi:hypothetical protein